MRHYEIETLVIGTKDVCRRAKKKRKRLARLMNCSLMYYVAAGHALACERVFSLGLSGEIVKFSVKSEGFIPWNNEFNFLTSAEQKHMALFYAKRKNKLLEISSQLASRISAKRRERDGNYFVRLSGAAHDEF